MKKVLSQTERILRSGGIVISPTDTVYGILGDATNAEAIKKMFALKQRPQEKAFPIFVKDIATARKYAYISDAKAKFLEKAWLAPLEISRPKAAAAAPTGGRISNGARALTVVFQHKEKLPKILVGGLGTIGIRIPDHEFLLKLLARLDFPLAQTSANVSGKPPAKTTKEIKIYFNDSCGRIRVAGVKGGGALFACPDLLIDGGEINGKPSTVIDFTGKEPIVLRAGLLSKSELDRLLNSVR